MLVGLCADNSGFVIFLVIVGGNSESLIALLADDLVDISSGEGENSLHDTFDLITKYLNSMRVYSVGKHR